MLDVELQNNFKKQTVKKRREEEEYEKKKKKKEELYVRAEKGSRKNINTHKERKDK